MKKMKLQMLGMSVNDLLSREQMKKVMGGSGGAGGSGGCMSDLDCKTGEKCFVLGSVASCQSTKGRTCTSDSDCSSGQKCVTKASGTGKWCV